MVFRNSHFIILWHADTIQKHKLITIELGHCHPIMQARKENGHEPCVHSIHSILVKVLWKHAVPHVESHHLSPSEGRTTWGLVTRPRIPAKSHWKQLAFWGLETCPALICWECLKNLWRQDMSPRLPGTQPISPLRSVWIWMNDDAWWMSESVMNLRNPFVFTYLNALWAGTNANSPFYSRGSWTQGRGVAEALYLATFLAEDFQEVCVPLIQGAWIKLKCQQRRSQKLPGGRDLGATARDATKGVLHW